MTDKTLIVEKNTTDRPTIAAGRTHPFDAIAAGDGRTAAAAVKRISWAAVVAGVVIVLVTQLLLSLLGLGIGASTINPITEENATAGLGIGAGVWFIILSLLALFAGGWVSGRLAGIPRKTDAMLHGLLTWGLATLLLFYFLTSTIGGLIGGTFRVLGSGLSAATTGAAAAAPSVAGAARQQLEESGVDVSGVRDQIAHLLRQTGAPSLQPGALAKQGQQAADAAQTAAGQAASDPANADTAISSILDRVSRSGAKTMAAVDRDALVNVIVARTGKTRPEAEQTVESYNQTYQAARQQYEQTKAAAEQKAREIGERTASTVSKAALSGFVALLLSAVAAAVGGSMATPRDVLSTREAFAPLS